MNYTREKLEVFNAGSIKIESSYNERGDAKHYDQQRLNAIIKMERTYGTLAVMTYCEINADKYRERIGKKKGQSLEQEVMKIEWYENAARHYFKKLKTDDEIIVDNYIKRGLEF